MNFMTFHILGIIWNNHPNWLIFFRGVETTNQLWFQISNALITGVFKQLMFGSNEMPSSESDVWKTAVIKKGVPENFTETHINCWGWVEQRNFECWNFETTKPGMKMLSATIQWTSGSHCVEDLCQWTPKWSAGSLAVDSNVCWWLFYLFYGWYKMIKWWVIWCFTMFYYHVL